jgi:hypothetical protein
MGGEIWVQVLTEHGPWALLVFYLLWRDGEKDRATREVLERNTLVLGEMTTILRERLPRAT